MDGEPYVAAYGKRSHNDLPEPCDGALVPQKDEKEHSRRYGAEKIGYRREYFGWCREGHKYLL